MLKDILNWMDWPTNKVSTNVNKVNVKINSIFIILNKHVLFFDDTYYKSLSLKISCCFFISTQRNLANHFKNKMWITVGLFIKNNKNNLKIKTVIYRA